MRFAHSSPASVLATLSLGAALMLGCGGGGGGRDLDDCGNGQIDSHEDCDDGNLEDTDTCLSTCEVAACGDGYLEAGVEECDLFVTTTCAALGFRTGTLACATDCRFDTSGCSGTTGPTPVTTATPAGATPTASGPTPTGGGPTATLATASATPTPQATPVGSLCNGSETITVVIALDGDVTSARIDVAYPAAANLPGTGTDVSVKDRVEFAGSGLTVVNDFDDDGDLVDDTLTVSLVGTDLVPAGTFATVSFDCQAGQAVPAVGSFTCTVVAASNAGTTATPGCTIR